MNKDIVVLTANSIAVDVPQGSHSYTLEGNRLRYEPRIYNNVIDLPEGTWTLLGKADSLTEEDWKKVVPFHWGESGLYDAGYWDYEQSTRERGTEAGTALESGLSLLKSKSLDPSTSVILVKLIPDVV